LCLSLGVNTLWRSALLAAARSLRQNILYGRIWGNPPSDPEQEQEQERDQDHAPFGTTPYASSSSSLDLPLTDRDAEASCSRRPRQGLPTGRVRGMVDKWERESAGSRSSTRRSNSSCSRSDSGSDNGSELGDDEMAAGKIDVSGALVSVFPDNGTGAVLAADNEPSIEDLLASESALAVWKPASWGARAWEELDAGTTMRRIEPHDTVVPRHDGNGGIGADIGSVPFGTLSKRGGGVNNSGSRRVRGTNKEDPRLARRTATDIFAVPLDTVSTPALAEAEVQTDIHVETEAEAELKANELVLKGEMQDTRTLLEEFRRRLEEVESRVSTMEAEEQRAYVSPQQLSEAQASTTPEKDMHDKSVEAPPKVASVMPECDPTTEIEIPADVDEKKVGRDYIDAQDDAYGGCADGPAVGHVVGLEPTTVSDLPSYVLLVGLGVCAVIFKVVLKRVGCRSLRP
jgi:hypothetical protein